MQDPKQPGRGHTVKGLTHKRPGPRDRHTAQASYTQCLIAAIVTLTKANFLQLGSGDANHGEFPGEASGSLYAYPWCT